MAKEALDALMDPRSERHTALFHGMYPSGGGHLFDEGLLALHGWIGAYQTPTCVVFSVPGTLTTHEPLAPDGAQ